MTNGAWAGRWTWGALAIALVPAAGMRLALTANSPAFITAEDSQDFFAAAYDLVQGGGFDLPLKRAPLYPLFLAGVVATLGPSLEAVAAVQHLLGLVSVALVFAIGTLAFGRWVGLAAALWVGLNGSLLTMEHTLIAEALFGPLLLGAVLVLLLALRPAGQGGWGAGGQGGSSESPPISPSPRLPVSNSSAPRLPGPPAPLLLIATAGLLLGLGALTRPAAQAIVPLVALALLCWPRPWRVKLAAVGMLGLGYLLVVGPWVARNRVVHGVAGISGGMGDALFTRTNRHDTTFTYRDRGRPHPEREHRRIRDRVFELAREERYSPTVRATIMQEFGLTAAQGDAYLREAALQVISQEPERYVRGTAEMFVKLALGYERGFDDNWEPRFKPKFQRTWPDQIEPAFLPPGPWPEEQQARAESILSLYRDQRAEMLIVLLFLTGSAICLAGWRRGLWVLPAIVLSQILVYVAMDGPLPRYRYSLQPLITLVATAGAFALAYRLAALWRAARAGAARGSAPDRVRTGAGDRPVVPRVG